MSAAPPIIETPRLRLRVPALDDAEAIFQEYGQDPEVTKFLSWKPHRQASSLRAYLSDLLAAVARGGTLAWVITARPCDRALGMIDLQIDGHRAAVGYVLARAYWGWGYLPEALGPVVEWALARPEIHRVWAFCDVENYASARVLEKVGMAREGTLRRWCVFPNLGADPRDCLSYSRVKEARPRAPEPGGQA